MEFDEPPNLWHSYSSQMPPDTDVQQQPPGAKLNLYSMLRCESLLRVNREHLRFVADHAGSYYRPFLKKDRTRPFQKKLSKTKKSPRPIDNPCGELKNLQRQINENILRHVVFPHYLCGGVPGKSVLDNVLLHLGEPVLVTVDIKSFFRRITNLQVDQVWRRTLNCSPKIADLFTRLTTFERHLPQGAPTSSLLANLVLYSIDLAIREECARRNVKYSTWVDDLAFSGKDAREVIPVVVGSLRSAGFSVSHRKLKIMGPGTRKVLNGVLMGRFPGVLAERIARLRSGIHKLRTNQVATKEKQKYVEQLEAGIAYVSSISPRKGAKLLQELQQDGAPYGATL
jgi:RNA-directed DNA polymerase